MRVQLGEEIASAERNSQEYREYYTPLLMEARRTGDPAAIQRVADLRKLIAEQVIARTGKKFLESRAQARLQHSQAALRPPASATTPPAPSGAPAAPGPNGTDQLIKQAGNWDQMFAASGMR